MSKKSTTRVYAHELIARAVGAGMPKVAVGKVLGIDGGAVNNVIRVGAIPPAGTWHKFLKWLPDGTEVIEPDGIPLYQPKEPLMPSPLGHGYQGVLLHDKFSQLVQCHACGGWYRNVGRHSFLRHGMSAREYKEATGLKYSSALTCEEFRQGAIVRAKARRESGSLIALSAEDRIRGTAAAKRTRRRGDMEARNQRGTCPLQLTTRTRALARELGRTPTVRELQSAGLRAALRLVWKKEKAGISAAGLRPNSKGDRTYPTYAQDPGLILERFRRFRVAHGRWPSTSDTKRGLLMSPSTVYQHFKSWKEAVLAAKTYRIGRGGRKK